MGKTLRIKGLSQRLWSRWSRRILSPQIPEDELNAKLGEVRRLMPTPVFWLLGKTQSGKTSIIRALTGSSSAEIGNGFQPCTQTARFYDFPDSASPLIRFLDTRGLSEAGYDPREDMEWCRDQAHLLIVVVKAMDHQLDGVIKATGEIHANRPEWPVIVAQTALHEGYRQRDAAHVLPYPYGQTPWPRSVPSDLARSLLGQRALFSAVNARFAPVDFTLPEDGFAPAEYGVEALWQAIEETLPLGLRALLGQREHGKILNDAYARKAHPHIVAYAASAGLASAIPAPAASLATATAIQAKLFHSIASIYGLPLTAKSVAEVGGAVGVGFLAGMGGRELAKLVPLYGQTAALGLAGLYTAAVTYALGRVFCLYFAGARRGRAFSRETLREFYREEFESGRALLADSLKMAKS